MTQRAKAACINAALLIGTILFFFLAAEAVVRMTGLVSLTPRPPQIYRQHENPAISYALKPNVRETAYRTTVTTNSRGLRGPELETSKPVLAVIGDSITFGYGIEDDETLPARLQEKFPAWSVANLGVPGYTLGQETELLREQVAAGLDPSAVLLVFYFNDLDDQRPPVLDGIGILREPGYEDTGAPACAPVTQGPLRFVPGQCWLNSHSAFFVGIRKFLSARQEQRNLAAQQEEYRANPGDDVAQEKLDAYAAKLDGLTAFLKDTPRMFVIWPEKHLHAVIRPKLKAMAEARGFVVVDLYDTFGNTPESLSWDTVHPSAATVKKAADIIAVSLENFRLVPQNP